MDVDAVIAEVVGSDQRPRGEARDVTPGLHADHEEGLAREEAVANDVRVVPRREGAEGAAVASAGSHAVRQAVPSPPAIARARGVPGGVMDVVTVARRSVRVVPVGAEDGDEAILRAGPREAALVLARVSRAPAERDRAVTAGVDVDEVACVIDVTLSGEADEVAGGDVDAMAPCLTLTALARPAAVRVRAASPVRAVREEVVRVPLIGGTVGLGVPPPGPSLRGLLEAGHDVASRPRCPRSASPARGLLEAHGVSIVEVAVGPYIQDYLMSLMFGSYLLSVLS